MDKRGLSPVLAAVLLISLAVIALIIFVAFGKERHVVTPECTPDVRLKLAVIGGEEQVCLRIEKNQIEFIIENGPNIEIKGLVVDLTTADDTAMFEFNETMVGKAGTYFGHIPYTAASEEFRFLKITPKVFLCNEEPLAINDALVISHLKPCSK